MQKFINICRYVKICRDGKNVTKWCKVVLFDKSIYALINLLITAFINLPISILTHVFIYASMHAFSFLLIFLMLQRMSYMFK